MALPKRNASQPDSNNEQACSNGRREQSNVTHWRLTLLNTTLNSEERTPTYAHLVPFLFVLPQISHVSDRCFREILQRHYIDEDSRTEMKADLPDRFFGDAARHQARVYENLFDKMAMGVYWAVRRNGGTGFECKRHHTNVADWC